LEVDSELLLEDLQTVEHVLAFASVNFVESLSFGSLVVLFMGL
jgi:hypothetical protein